MKIFLSIKQPEIFQKSAGYELLFIANVKRLTISAKKRRSICPKILTYRFIIERKMKTRNFFFNQG